MPSLPTPRFDTFPRYEELTQLLFAYAEARPNLVSVRSIGKSYEGRDIWLLVLTNTATGADVDKPALWVDGNIHAAELTACTTCLYYLHQLLQGHGSEAQITQLLDSLGEFRSAQELHDELRRRGENIGLTTVYRTLQAMSAANVVDTLRTDTGESVYRRCSGSHHHHHQGSY